MTLSAQTPDDVSVAFVPETAVPLREHMVPREGVIRATVPAHRPAFCRLRLKCDVQDQEHRVHAPLHR